MKKTLLIFTTLLLTVVGGYSQTTDEFLNALKGSRIITCQIMPAGEPFFAKTVQVKCKNNALFESVTISSSKFRYGEQPSNVFAYSEWKDSTGAIRILLRKKIEGKQGYPVIKNLDKILANNNSGSLKSAIISLDLTGYTIKSCDSVKATSKESGFKKQEPSDKKIMRILVVKLLHPEKEILLFSNTIIKEKKDAKKIKKVRIALDDGDLKIIKRSQLKRIAPEVLDELDIIIQLRDA